MSSENKGWARLQEAMDETDREHLSDPPVVDDTAAKPTRAAVREESHRSYDKLMAQLKPVELDTVAGLAGDDEEPAKPPAEGHYHLLIVRNAQIPQVRRFTSPSFLAAHMQQLVDEDAYVIPFHGQVFPYTQGPERLLLASEEVAITFHPGGSPTIVELTESEREELVCQKDYFIGPPELVDIEYDEAPYMETSDALVDEMDEMEEDDDFDEDDLI